VVATAYSFGSIHAAGQAPRQAAGLQVIVMFAGSARWPHTWILTSARSGHPLDAGPYPLWADALTIKVREDGRVVNVHALIVTGFNAGGHHEILGETPTRPKTALAGILVRPGRPAAYRPATGHRRCPSRAGRHISSAATTCPRC
jgi:hypothetical protein